MIIIIYNNINDYYYINNNDYDYLNKNMYDYQPYQYQLLLIY